MASGKKEGRIFTTKLFLTECYVLRKKNWGIEKEED